MALIKGLLLLGASLLSVAVLLRWWVRTRGGVGRFLAVTAGLLVVVMSFLDVSFTLSSVTGYVDNDLILRYLKSTRHGTAVIVRTGTVVLFVTLAVLPAWRASLYLLVPAWLALLGTFSYSSHASAMAGNGALVLDWVHFLAGAAWISVILTAVIATDAWLAHDRLLPLMRVVSAFGLASVAVITASGVLSSLLHVAEPERFFGSPYSWALGAKILIVIVTVGVAALNRFIYLPRVRTSGELTGLRRSMLVESALLVAVFVATGILTTSPLPHGQEFPGLMQNWDRLIHYLWR